MDLSDTSSHDLHRLTALVWDASVPISFTALVPGQPPATGHFLVPRMIPVHLCTKPMFEALAAIAQFGTDKYKSWFEYKSRFNKVAFTAVIPWSVPIVVVLDWLAALEFPDAATGGSAAGKDPLDRMLEENALPLELKYVAADAKATDDVPPDALLQSQFQHADKQFAHKLWFSALLGSASEAVKLAPNIERSLRSWDAHTFFRGRRDLAKKAGDRVNQSLVAFHVVQPVTRPPDARLSMTTTLRLVDTGAERVSTFGQLLKTNVFQHYSRLSADQCMSTEPLAAELGFVRVLGMNPPLYTPLAFMRDHLCGRDFALHVVVRPLPNLHVALPGADASASNALLGANLEESFVASPTTMMMLGAHSASSSSCSAAGAGGTTTTTTTTSGGGGGAFGFDAPPSAAAEARAMDDDALLGGGRSRADTAPSNASVVVKQLPDADPNI